MEEWQSKERCRLVVNRISTPRAKKELGKFTYSSCGPGTLCPLIGECFKNLTGTDFLHVPFKGVRLATWFRPKLSGALAVLNHDDEPSPRRKQRQAVTLGDEAPETLRRE